MTLIEAARNFIAKTEFHRENMKHFLQSFARNELRPGDSYGATSSGERERAREQFEALCMVAPTDDVVVATYKVYLEAVRQPIPSYLVGDEEGRKKAEDILEQHRVTWARFVRACGVELS